MHGFITGRLPEIRAIQVAPTGAPWLQPAASSTAVSTIAPDDYAFQIPFIVPKCTIPMTMALIGSAAADNSYTLTIDGTIPVSSCTGPNCFSTARNFAKTGLTLWPGTHTLSVLVHNNGGYCGVSIKATLTARCAECERCPTVGQWDGANCFIGKALTGTSAFQFANNFYYTPLRGNLCPLTGSHFDGANCFVMTIPPSTAPFIWDNGWYVKPVACEIAAPVAQPRTE